MKIKGTTTSVTLSDFPKILGISAIIGIAIRCIQMAKFIDSETGFTTGGKLFSVILILLLVATVLAFLVKAFLSAESEKLQLQGVKSTPLGAATLFFSVSLLFDFVSGLTAMSDAGATGDFKNLMLTGAMPRFIQSVFALFSAFYFLLLAKDFRNGTEKASKHRILAITPVGWAGFRMICRFVRQISFVRVSDLFLELVMLAFMLIFFMALAQVVSGVYSDGFSWRIPSFGAAAALVAVILSVPRLIFTVVSFEKFINPQHTFQLSDLAFFVFILLLTMTVCKDINPYTAYDNGNDGEE